MKEISVIMPIFNSEKTLENTIKSLVNQKIDVEYEIILINDGSIDNSEKICLEYLEKYKNIKYKKLKNSGVSNARNEGIKISDARYIMFIDSDDIYEENMLQEMYKTIVSNDVDLAICGYNRINQKTGKKTIKRLDNKKYSIQDFGKLIEETQDNNMFNQVWNKIFKAEIIKNNEILFDNSIEYGEDYRFVIGYLNNSNSVYVTSQNLYNYINTTDGLNMKYRKDRIYINMDNLFLVEEIFKNNNYNLEYIDKKFFKTFISGLCNIYDNPNKSEIKQETEKLYSNKKIMDRLKNINDNKTKIILILINNKMYNSVFVVIIVMRILKRVYKKLKSGY